MAFPVTSITSILYVGALMTPAAATYEPRDPSRTVFYNVIAEHLETFVASLHDDPDAKGLPAYVEREFYDYLQCGILAYGFLRLGCDTCPKETLLAFSCKRRAFCPSCAGRRMAQTAAHLVECVMPWVATRQWVVSVPIPLRYWMASSRDLTRRFIRSSALPSRSFTSTEPSNKALSGKRFNRDRFRSSNVSEVRSSSISTCI